MMIETVAQRVRRSVGYRGARRGLPVRLPRPRPRLIAALLVILLLLGGAWLWLRDSSLVAVNRVAVTGASGPDAAQIRHALDVAARNMTTLDVHLDQLRTAVAPFPVVKDLRVTTHFPHGMRIRVIEQIPVAVLLLAGGRRIAVAGDGTLLHDVIATQGLPVVPVSVPPGGSRLNNAEGLAAVQLLAGAPYQLLSRVTQVNQTTAHGMVATLQNGPSVYFGDATRIADKWSALAAVLADPSSAGAVYIDVTDPDRPAGGGVGPGSTTSTSSGTSAPGG